MVTRARLIALLIVWGAAIAGAGFLLVAPRGTAPVFDPLSAHSLLSGGTLRVGVDPSNPPFAFIDEQGDLRGFEIDLAQAIAASLGVPLQFVTLGFDGLYDALASDRTDILIAGVTVDTGRIGGILYSRPYFDVGLLLVSDDPAHVTMARMSGRRLAYEYGSIGDSEAHVWLRRVAPFTLMPYQEPGQALDAVRLGDADAAISDAVTLAAYRRTHPDWQLYTSLLQPAPLAIVTRGDRPQIAVMIDHALNSLAFAGELAALCDRWLVSG